MIVMMLSTGRLVSGARRVTNDDRTVNPCKPSLLVLAPNLSVVI